MILKVKKIKNLGIFHNYSSLATTPELRRYNLIYGWNGSGKTTFSRLFSILEAGESERFPDLEYRLDSSSGNHVTQGVPYTESKIMVFNQEYVRDNAPSLDDPKARTKHIYLLGKEDKELAKEIEEDKSELGKLKESVNPKVKTSLAHRKKELETTRAALFKGVADTIAAIKGGAPVRNYNRRNAAIVYDSLVQKEELNRSELDAIYKIVDQQLLSDVNEFSIASIPVQRNGKVEDVAYSEFLENIVDSAKSTLSEKVQQALIERLKSKEDIAEWVAQGVALHKEHASDNCEYCGATITQTRIEELARHFNDSYAALISKIDKQIKGLGIIRSKLTALRLPDSANFYSQYQESYSESKALAEQERDNLVLGIDSIIETLENKKTKTHESVEFSDKLTAANLDTPIKAVNAIIGLHNAHTRSFKSTVDAGRRKLEKHYVSTIFDEVKKIDKEINELDEQLSEANSRIELLNTSIAKDEATIRNSGIACGDINKCLVGILGRDELVFEDKEEGYIINRNGVVAENISEGEKTAIAFAYFIIHLNSKDFNLKEGIVVIDDPISSLDTEGIFRICTLIDTKLKNAKQLILLTHNFDFFNHIKRWFMHDPVISGGGAKGQNQGNIIMLKPRYDDVAKRRVVSLDLVDPLLKDYESEYHYLFKKLFRFKIDTAVSEQGTIEAVYHYPNVARKVLECFLSFRVPVKGTMYTRMLKMKEFSKDISTTDIKEVYAFINSNSHLDTKTGLIQFDPALGVNGVRYIEKTLELIEKCDPKHYSSMVKLTS